MKKIIENLAAMTRLRGVPLSVNALTAQVSRHDNGQVNWQNMVEVLNSHGFENSISERPLTDIPDAALPALVFLKNEDARVIRSINQQQQTVTVLDEQGYSSTVSLAEIQAKYLGYCWFIKTPIKKDQRSELPEYTMDKAWLWKVIWRYRSYYSQVIVATVLINLLALVSSLYVMNVYDRVIPNQAYQTLWALSIGVFIAMFFEFLAKLLRAYLTDIAGKKADLIISSALFRRVLALDLSQKPASAGSYVNNLKDFESVRDFMTSATLLAVIDLPFILLFVAVIYMVAGQLALVPLLTIPLVILVGVLAQKPLAKYTLESMKEGAQRQGLAVEAVEGLETIKANNASSWAQQRWDQYTALNAASALKGKNISNFVTYFSMLLQQLNTVIIVLWGTYLIHHEVLELRITMGALIAAVILTGRTLAPLGQVAGLAIRYQQTKVALEGISSIVGRLTERDYGKNYSSLQHCHGDLQFNDVAFQYKEEGKPAVIGASIKLSRGEKVAIVGPVGSGKSTLLRLSAGMYKPQQGLITLDSIDLRQLDPVDLRHHISLLSQYPRLFLGTLRENMQFACMDRVASDEDIYQALARFGLSELVQQNANGLDLMVGENGDGLSGGQRQLLNLARLTLREPKIVLLDEPTSDLDQNSEHQALEQLAHWGKDKTLLVVTHRPSVLRIVERIIVMNNGQVVMDGKRDDVLNALNNPAPSPEQTQGVQRQSVKISTGNADGGQTS